MLGHCAVDRLDCEQMFMAPFLTVETCPLTFTEGPPLPQMIEEEESNEDETHMDINHAGQPSAKKK